MSAPTARLDLSPGHGWRGGPWWCITSFRDGPPVVVAISLIVSLWSCQCPRARGPRPSPVSHRAFPRMKHFPRRSTPPFCRGPFLTVSSDSAHRAEKGNPRPGAHAGRDIAWLLAGCTMGPRTWDGDIVSPLAGGAMAICSVAVAARCQVGRRQIGGRIHRLVAPRAWRLRPGRTWKRTPTPCTACHLP